MLIALTGGIGSGKSTVARAWASLGATEIDADVLAREVVEPGAEGLNLVVEEFGVRVLNPDGTLNRSELARRVFASDSARKALEGLLHPLIQRVAERRIRKSNGVIVYTIPLLVESESPLQFDKVVTISCPEEIRLRRLTARGLSEEETRRRLAVQATDAERERRADVVIRSDCELPELIRRALKVYREINGRPQ
jgi:dephospho-CoA kinase